MWNTFLLNLLGIVIIWVVSFIITLPAIMSGIGNSVFSGPDNGTLEQPQWYWVLIGLSSVISSLLWIIPFTFLAMQYFNLDERFKPAEPVL